MDNQKSQFIALIETLPEEKLTAAIQFLEAMEGKPPATSGSTHQLLMVLVSTLTNTLYDLSDEAEKRCAKAAAKRLDVARRKIIQAWEDYNASR